MNTRQFACDLSDNVIDSQRLISGLRHALDSSYRRVIATAQDRWERIFDGTDPSDACVSVRITSGKPSAGILRKPACSVLHGNGRDLLA
jgi:hypothetical protein